MAKSHYKPLSERQIKMLKQIAEDKNSGSGWFVTRMSLETRGLIEEKRDYRPDNPNVLAFVYTALTEQGQIELAKALEAQRLEQEELLSRPRVEFDPWVETQKHISKFRERFYQKAFEEYELIWGSDDAFIISTNQSTRYPDNTLFFQYSLTDISSGPDYSKEIACDIVQYQPLEKVLLRDRTYNHLPPKRLLKDCFDHSRLVSYTAKETEKWIRELYKEHSLEYKPDYPIFDLRALYEVYRGLWDTVNNCWYNPFNHQLNWVELWKIANEVRVRRG